MPLLVSSLRCRRLETRDRLAGYHALAGRFALAICSSVMVAARGSSTPKLVPGSGGRTHMLGEERQNFESAKAHAVSVLESIRGEIQVGRFQAVSFMPQSTLSMGFLMMSSTSAATLKWPILGFRRLSKSGSGGYYLFPELTAIPQCFLSATTMKP